MWDNDGNPHCSSCYDNMHDDDAPNNPAVHDADRRLILELSRNWLSGKSTHSALIKINPKDFLLQKIRDKVGLVDTSIYIFGLQDRDEYQLMASPNVLQKVREYALTSGLDLKVTEGTGCNRIGISYSLRKDNIDFVVNLLKQVSIGGERCAA